ncbi:LacI family DNA-binding transcriptional regulator [Streptomyces sp. NPDC052687]|uniref:LacI family DNA-binding transcriptional regulator n=1 Tax=Streptomyces sp. NPDC052687 TaxID=3154759 RepID=UPI003428580C
MVKITDVARHAGVSPSTVSYTLSGKRPISEETRRRVQESIRALGYRPHGARSAYGGRTNVLALVLPLHAGVHIPVAMDLAVSVVNAARAYDHDVLILTRHDGRDGEDGLPRLAETPLVDALIVTDVRLHDPRLPLLRDLHRPTVLIGYAADRTAPTCVDLDFAAAGEACVDHLAALGHRAVALIGSPPEVYVRRTAYAQRLVQGFTAAADRHGLASAVHPCAATPEAARATAERLLREQPALTGVVVHNEAVLDPLLDAFGRLGLRVPDDLSVVALCPTAQAESARVPLTSVALPATEIGTRAVDLLIRELNGEQVPATTLLPPRLTVRASTARRRSSA